MRTSGAEAEQETPRPSKPPSGKDTLIDLRETLYPMSPRIIGVLDTGDVTEGDPTPLAQGVVLSRLAALRGLANS